METNLEHQATEQMDDILKTGDKSTTLNSDIGLESQEMIQKVDEEEIIESEDADIVETEPGDKSIWNGAELLTLEVGELPQLVEGIFPKFGVAALCGSSDTGKSLLLRQLAIAIVQKKEEFLGFKLNADHGSVLYISTEDDKIATAFILKKQCVEVELSDLRNLNFMFEFNDIIRSVSSYLKSNPVDCVIVDAFSDVYDGDLNQSNKVRGFINGFAGITRKRGCLVIFLHHTGKRTDNSPPSKDNILGSQGFEAKMRVVLELRKDPENDKLRHLCILKGNYIGDNEKNSSYVLQLNENKNFDRLPIRVPFDKLAKLNSKKPEKMAARQRAIELHKQGKSTRVIAKILKDEGYQVGKTTVHDWVKDGRPSETPKGNEPGQSEVSKDQPNQSAAN